MMNKQIYKIKKRYRQLLATPLVLSFGLVLGAFMVAGIYFLFFHHTGFNPIPSKIKQQASFVVFYPGTDPSVTVDANSFKYSSQSQLMSYKITYNNAAITIAEQSTPQNFIDIPQAYDKLIESLNVYASFDSYYDKVNLTHPKEFNGQQSAVMNSKGTLVFAHPTKGELTEDQWKKLFNGLEIIR
jgi:hypothetical protein